MKAIHRVLKDDGMVFSITSRPTLFIRPFLNSTERLWHVKMQILDSDKGTLGYYGYVLHEKLGVVETDDDSNDTSSSRAGSQEAKSFIRTASSKDVAPDDSSDENPYGWIKSVLKIFHRTA
ncbi:hypothetical protein N8I77_001723 [Diaporthe amygdali]|uniref:Uncharacterized protein n=1 Tax=Phomopsis amygdali TaxID=1214568 RepID=A0AAD9SSL4_PHOAM|nr:hypothetical protein N8I77_001723 [Diaporthe amygdali]